MPWHKLRGLNQTEPMLTDDEIEAQVMQKYPVTEKEKICLNEAMHRDYLRIKYRKKLKQENDQSAETGIIN